MFFEERSCEKQSACHLMVSCLGHYKYYIYLDDHNEISCNDYIQQYLSTIDGFSYIHKHVTEVI